MGEDIMPGGTSVLVFAPRSLLRRGGSGVLAVVLAWLEGPATDVARLGDKPTTLAVLAVATAAAAETRRTAQRGRFIVPKLLRSEASTTRILRVQESYR